MKKLLALSTMLIASTTCALADDDGTIDKKANFYYEQMDSNNDNIVSRAEYNAYSKYAFDSIDQNKDNALSFQELHAAELNERENLKPRDNKSLSYNDE